MTSPHEDVRDYVVGTNADRTNAETYQILAELLQSALHADPDYRLPVPTLLLHGDADRVGDIVDATRAWAARDERAEYVVVPGGRARQQPGQPGRVQRAPCSPSSTASTPPRGVRRVDALRAAGWPPRRCSRRRARGGARFGVR